MYRHHPAFTDPARGQRRGFTLVELLVVITIIAMLVGLLVPAVLAARNAARKSQCLNNQKQLATAVLNYTTQKQKFPPAFSLQPDPNDLTPNQEEALGWVPPILPYIEQNELYRLIQGNTLRTQTTPIAIDILQCPSRDLTTSPAPLSYVVNAGAQDDVSPGRQMDFQQNGVFFDEFTPRNPLVPAAMRPRPTPPIDTAYLSDHDGNARTIMLAESNDARDWYDLGSPTTPTDAKPGTPGNGADPYGMASDGQSWWNAIIWVQPPVSAPANWGTPGDSNTSSILRNTGVVSSAPKSDAANGHPSSNHSGGFHLTFCDGRSQFVSDDIEYRVYCLLMAPSNAEAKYAHNSAGGTHGDPVVYPANWHQMMMTTLPLTPLSDQDIR
jgi:prepilin-type N-terminal cleavage/methylation domain-containing protein